MLDIFSVVVTAISIAPLIIYTAILNIRSTLPLVSKVLMNLFVAVVAVGVYYNVLQLRGYSVEAAVPDKAPFLYAHVVEPNLKSAGKVYLWILVDGHPKAIELPYSKELHKKVLNANKSVGNGERPTIKSGNGVNNGENGRGVAGPMDFVPPPDTLPTKE